MRNNDDVVSRGSLLLFQGFLRQFQGAHNSVAWGMSPLDPRTAFNQQQLAADANVFPVVHTERCNGISASQSPLNSKATKVETEANF